MDQLPNSIFKRRLSDLHHRWEVATFAEHTVCGTNVQRLAHKHTEEFRSNHVAESFPYVCGFLVPRGPRPQKKNLKKENLKRKNHFFKRTFFEVSIFVFRVY